MPAEGKNMNAQVQNPMRGIVLVILAWLIIPVMDGGAKYLSNIGYPMLLIVWGRFFFNLLLLVPPALVSRRNLFIPGKNLRVQVIRAVALVGATVFFFSGLKTMPLADALATYFVYPLFVTAFAPLFLGERPGVRRWSAVGVGFIGSLLIIRPGFTEIADGTTYVLVAAVCFAVYNLLTKTLSGQGDAWQTLGFQMLVGTVIMTPVLAFVWMPLDLMAIGILFLMAAASAVGHFLIIHAYEHAPASVLAPFSYFEIISATLIGYILFGDFPSTHTWAGVFVIICSGIYISYRERVTAKSGKV